MVYLQSNLILHIILPCEMVCLQSNLILHIILPCEMVYLQSNLILPRDKWYICKVILYYILYQYYILYHHVINGIYYAFIGIFGKVLI